MVKLETTAQVKKSVKSVKMVDLFKRVVSIIKDKGFIPGFDKAKKEVTLISKSLSIGMEEAYMLPLLFESGSRHSLEFDFGISKIEFMYFAEAVNNLSYEGLINISDSGICWSIPNNVARAILRGSHEGLCDYNTLSAEQLAQRLEDCIAKRLVPVSKEDRTDRFKYLLDKLMNAENPLLEKLVARVRTSNELLNRYYMALSLLIINNAIMHGNLFSFPMLLSFAKSLDDNFKKVAPTAISDLFSFFKTEGVVELEAENKTYGQHFRLSENFARKFHFHLAKKKTVEQLYAKPARGLNMGAMDMPDEDGKETPVGYAAITNKSIMAKQLYYNADEQENITRLAGIFDDAKLKRVQNRLEVLGRKGFVCLFYGAPGTGKTETSLQLAKVSGRDIFSVDVSEIKSRWMGESEKNLRGVFKSYNEAIAKAKEEHRPFPILLLNEADSLVTKRVSVTQSSDQVQNSMQNILLQEFEATEGIIICTTNLTSNMDDAFERRFLYKVEFNRPGTDVRTRIWQDKLPMLTGDECAQLGADYDFSGGEIENVVRKALIDSALEDEDVVLAKVVELANQERLKGSSNHRKVGFVD